LNYREIRMASIVAFLMALSPLAASAQNAPAAAAPPASQPAVDPSKVVITIGDVKITAGEFNTYISDLPPEQQAQVINHADGRRRLAEEIVKLKVLSAEARKRQLDQTAKTKIIYEQLLANALMTDLTEQRAENEKFFNEHKDFFDEVKARHILVSVEGSPVPGAHLTDAQAKAKAEGIKKRLDKGEDFAAIARTESDDSGSGKMGGDLGSVSRGMMVAPFEEAVFSLKKMEISQPVKTQFGYHIIQVMDRTPVTFDQARQSVAQKRLDALIDQLKDAAKPQLDDSFFGAPPPKAQASAAPRPAGDSVAIDVTH